MKRRMAIAAAVALAGMAALTPLATAGSNGSAVREPLPTLNGLSAGVLNPPTPVLGTDKRRHLVYEIALINVTPVAQRVDRVQVLNGADRSVLVSYARPAAIRTILTDAARVHDGITVLPASGSGMLWLDVSFAAGARVPDRLAHRIDTTLLTKPARKLTVNGARTAVSSRAPVVLGAPLLGKRYVNSNGCCDQSPHTRALLTIDGQRWLAQRFAIDWLRIDAKGRDFVGTPTKNSNWLIFGDSVIAAGSGVVTSVLNNLPENTPPIPLANLTAQNALGNHVIEDLGGGRYALYAHLQPGSVTVRVGQRIHRGQLLGRVGNTGSSTAPHLHFHVTDGPDVIASSGVPYVFDHFALTGEVLNLDAFARDDNPEPARLGPAERPLVRHDQLPLQRAVVTFTR